MRKIILNDGTVYEDSDVGFADGVIWCFIKNKTIVDVFHDFSDPAKIEKIVYEYGEDQKVYEGFTHLSGIMEEYDRISILLKRN